MIAKAKMRGMTPLPEIFMGMTEDCGAAHLLCILHGDLALCKVDKDDAEEHHHRKDKEADDLEEGRNVVRRDRRELVEDGKTRRGDDTHEDDERDAVADTVLGDALTQPHDEHRARRVDDDHVDDREPLLVEEQIPADARIVGDIGREAAREVDDDADRLNDGEHDRDDARDVRELLPALFALLGEALERGDAHGEELHDNGCVDVRPDPERKQRAVRKRAARDAAHQSQKVVRSDRIRQKAARKSRNGDIAPDAEHDEKKKR